MARSLRFDQNDHKYLYSHCNDPICDSKRRKTLQELDLAKSKLKRLQSNNGFDEIGRQNVKTYSHSNCVENELYSKTRDMTRTLLTTNDPNLLAQRTSKPATNIAEIETVL